jgi:hypothetical protein
MIPNAAIGNQPINQQQFGQPSHADFTESLVIIEHHNNYTNTDVGM